ncbi:porin family protein [uncultured Psychroserpens sp.]|uniref:porin family protein n=1 Tax=uncultured Psychroserpens sp. TaxID=255436 RepID=UPI00261FA786|nr:porin family protein [uncultured Psychroserpens sp.]
MKKLMLLAAIAVFGLTNVNAQETTFGALAGLSILTPDVDGVDTDSETGFHIGAFADIGISESFSVQPELTYEMAGDISLLNVNAMAKYHVSEEFNIQLGPQVGFAGGDDIDALDDLLGDDFTKLNLRLAVGAGYDITEDIFVQARYGFQLNDHFTGDGDGSVKINTLNLSVGYKF